MALESKLDDPPRSLGAEFECAVPIVGHGSNLDVQERIAHILNANGLRAGYRGYTHLPVPPNLDVVVETDSSVRGEARIAGVAWATLEIKTRVIYQGITEYESIVSKTLEVLRTLNCRVNASCGHHLHVGFPEVLTDAAVLRSLFNTIHRFEPVIYSLVSPSRRNNQYCRPLPDVSKLLHKCRTLDCFERTLSQFDRYMGCRWTECFGHDGAPRIEFRYHQGTLDPTKAIHWARFCTQIINHAAARSCQAAPVQVPGTKAGLKKMLTTCGFRVNTKVYSRVSPSLRLTGRWLLLTRWKELNPTGDGLQAHHSD